VGPARAASIADLPWWDVFRDEALSNLVRESLRGNLDLRAAAARVDEARALAAIARSELFRRGYRRIPADEGILLLPAGGHGSTANAFFGR
jgi:hypothetical protein